MASCPHTTTSQSLSYLSQVRRVTPVKKQLPVLEVVREWRGGRAAVDEFDEMVALKSEVERQRKLVELTAQWLRESGHRVKASLLLNELNRSENSIKR